MQVRSWTSNLKDSIRGYKKYQELSTKDFERRLSFRSSAQMSLETHWLFLGGGGVGSSGDGYSWQNITATRFEAGPGVHWLPSRETTWHG